MKLLARVRLPADVDVAGVSHHAVFLKGFTAHVAHAGKGEPVILLHGWPQHWWAWRHLIGPLAADGRSLICPDLRGFGWSSTPAAGYSADQFAADLLKLLDVLELERVDLVAHDWGAVTGFSRLSSGTGSASGASSPSALRARISGSRPRSHFRCGGTGINSSSAPTGSGRVRCAGCRRRGAGLHAGSGWIGCRKTSARSIFGSSKMRRASVRRLRSIATPFVSSCRARSRVVTDVPR